MERSFERIDPGSKILVGQILGAEYLGPYYSLPCLAMMERSSLVSLAFSNPRQQVLTVRPPFRAISGGFDDDPPPIAELQVLPTSSRFAPSGRIYWKDWPQNYDYLYLLSSDHQPNPMPDRLIPLDEGHGFQLYRIRR